MMPIETPKSLVAFTSLAPMAAGAWIVAGTLTVAGVYPAGAFSSSLGILLAALVLLVVAFACSTAHLGSPLRSFSAFNRVGSSNLSNEVLNGFLLVMFALAYVAVCYSGALDMAVDAVLAILSILLAVLFVFVSCRAYRMPTVPAWNAFSFSAGFIADAVLGGAAFVACAAAVVGGYDLPVMAGLVACALLGLAASAAVSLLQTRHVAVSVNDWRTAREKVDSWVPLVAAKGVLQGVGVAIIVAGLALSLAALWWVVGLVLVVAGIVAGRCAFYRAYDCVGLPR